METWFDRLPREVMAARPRLLLALSMLREKQNRWGETLEALARAESLLPVGGELDKRVHVLRRQGWIHFRHSHYAQAKELCHQVLAHLPPDDSRRPPSLLQELAAVYRLLGNCYAETDDIDRGRGYFQRAIEISETLGDRIGQAKALHNLAVNVHFAQGRLAAWTNHAECGTLAHNRVVSLRWEIIYAPTVTKTNTRLCMTFWTATPFPCSRNWRLY